MKKRTGLPAVGRTTMLGLNLAKTLEYTTWLRILPTTTSATPKKQSYVLATSAPSPTCPEPPQLKFWESLDTCLQRNGSMEPFHSLFDQTHLDADVAEPKDDDITNHDIYEDELIHAYQHYCELIDVGDPQNCRDKDFSAQKPDQEEDNGVVTAGTATHGAGGLAVEASGDMVSDNPCEPMTHAESVPQEDSMQPGSRSTLNNEIKITPLSTPAEAAAWAHSYCDADPESTKIKILTDDGGKEYVLYHDCFHCVPIDLAPELIHITEEDDGYGSAPETCETAKDGTKLGTIPEDENEDDEAGGGSRDEVDEEGDVEYAAPSDLCQGVCLLHKVDEGNWYSDAFSVYFEEFFSPPFRKQSSANFKGSRLRQVQSIEEMEQDEK
ncbi:hypothetical protein UCDDA912_g02250 [Diaporthe ampelina]|uniref:Uncharacterized protein n=1 Tax=Diaporthe ampelina TaxID=1214573 RepID=A0A0G2FUR9_9PEZI|nr:hypothetical protein UCDDA912_g02250 [Diaporthe ampelina]